MCDLLEGEGKILVFAHHQEMLDEMEKVIEQKVRTITTYIKGFFVMNSLRWMTVWLLNRYNSSHFTFQ